LCYADVLQPCPELLRTLRQQLREQIPLLARRELRHAMRRQAHEGIAKTRRPLPGAKCCDGTTGWSARQVILLLSGLKVGEVATSRLCPNFSESFPWTPSQKRSKVSGNKITVQYLGGTSAQWDVQGRTVISLLLDEMMQRTFAPHNVIAAVVWTILRGARRCHMRDVGATRHMMVMWWYD